MLGKTQCAELVLAADCIYDSEVLKPLLWTAAQLLAPPSAAATTATTTKTTTKARPPAFVLSYCGRCLLSDAEFDRRLREIGEGAGLCLVSTTYLADFPKLAESLDKETATKMREANARVFVFEVDHGGDGGGKQEAT